MYVLKGHKTDQIPLLIYSTNAHDAHPDFLEIANHYLFDPLLHLVVSVISKLKMNEVNITVVKCMMYDACL